MSVNEFERDLGRAAEMLRTANRVTVLTGAGVSAESGVPTFRDAGGLWEGQRIEDVATPRGFARNPDLVWEFYNQRRSRLSSILPNPGHRALVELEKRLADGFTLVTQNVDGLHQMAGSQRVLEIHGNIRRTRCLDCATISDRGFELLGARPVCSQCGGQLRPDVVWFEEPLPIDLWVQAEAATIRCDVFLIVGTSAIVYPAAGLGALARKHNRKVIEINLQRTSASDVADVSLIGPSGMILPQLLCHSETRRITAKAAGSI